MQGKFEKRAERHQLGNENDMILLIINNCDFSSRVYNISNNNNDNKSDHSLAMSLVGQSILSLCIIFLLSDLRIICSCWHSRPSPKTRYVYLFVQKSCACARQVQNDITNISRNATLSTFATLPATDRAALFFGGRMVASNPALLFRLHRRTPASLLTFFKEWSSLAGWLI